MNTFWRKHDSRQHSRKWTVCTWGWNFGKTVGNFWMSLWAPSCRLLQHVFWLGLSCFSLQITVAGEKYSAFYLFLRLIDGLLNPGLVKGCKMEATTVESHSFVSEWRQIEQSGGLLVVITDVSSICCGQLGFRFRRRLCGGSFWPKNSHFSFRNLRCNTFHIWSFHCEHTQVLVILMFVFTDFPANSTPSQGSPRFTRQFFSLPQWGWKSLIMKNKVPSLACRTSCKAIFSMPETVSPSRVFQCLRELFLLLMPFLKSLHLTHGVQWSICWLCYLRIEGMLGEGCFAPQNIKGVSRALVWRRQCGITFGRRRNCLCRCPNLTRL